MERGGVVAVRIVTLGLRTVMRVVEQDVAFLRASLDVSGIVVGGVVDERMRTGICRHAVGIGSSGGSVKTKLAVDRRSKRMWGRERATTTGYGGSQASYTFPEK